MQLNEKQKQILQAIHNDAIGVNQGFAEDNLSKALNFNIPLIRHSIEDLEKYNFVQVIRSLGSNYDGSKGISSILLTDKGKVAVESPEDLIPEPNPVINTISIPGSVNAPIAILQNSDQNTVTVNQAVDQSITEVLKSIDYLSQATENFPEDKRELATVHLDDLKEEIQQPERRKPQKIRAYFMAFLGIALPLLGYVANTTDFVNNITDLANKFNVEVELPQLSQLK